MFIYNIFKQVKIDAQISNNRIKLLSFGPYVRLVCAPLVFVKTVEDPSVPLTTNLPEVFLVMLMMLPESMLIVLLLTIEFLIPED